MMGRQVRKMGVQRDAVRTTGAGPSTGDAYLERLLKLIPAETVAVYLFVQGVLQSGLAEPARLDQLQIWLWIVFGIFVVGNILYVRRFHDVTDPVQYLILTLAFAVWVFTLGGPFQYLGFYEPFMGSVILAIFTFFVPIVYQGVPVS
jgi:hypothetical protein